ncbi:MAG: alcohol dehydrogenase catalytic domain-containing protein [Gracilibacteraceae bacterium]|jgi:threonine dehydrogenase-like Zn-dependent dehydrogenase|nr:alcohol dehydrogenase catalytic domain-containing protein [Gracilibacteraceae bacterium]
MKALVYAGKQRAELRDAEKPLCRNGEILLRITYCGICGSDIGIYNGAHPRAKAPLIFGHEFIGAALAGSGDGSIREGDRVAVYPLLSCGYCLSCRTGSEHVCSTLRMIGIDQDGGMAEFAAVEESKLVLVPSGVSDKAAALIEPLAVIIRSLHQSGVKALDKAAIIGAGPIGVLTGILLRKMGLQDVLISDIDQERLRLAAGFGLETAAAGDAFLKKAQDISGGEGVDVLFECSGAPAAALQMSRVARISGTICMTAVHKAPHEVDLRDINFREQRIIGTRVYTKEEFRQAAAYAPVVQAELESLATHILPLSASGGVFDLIGSPASGAMKVLIDCRA